MLSNIVYKSIAYDMEIEGRHVRAFGVISPNSILNIRRKNELYTIQRNTKKTG